MHCVHVDINEGSVIRKESTILQRILMTFRLNRSFKKTHIEIQNSYRNRRRTVDAIDQMVAARRTAGAENRSKHGIRVETKARNEEISKLFTIS